MDYLARHCMKVTKQNIKNMDDAIKDRLRALHSSFCSSDGDGPCASNSLMSCLSSFTSTINGYSTWPDVVTSILRLKRHLEHTSPTETRRLESLCAELQNSTSLHKVSEIIDFFRLLSKENSFLIGDGLWQNSIQRSHQSSSPESGFATTPADGPSTAIFPGIGLQKIIPFSETRVLLPVPPTSFRTSSAPVVPESELIRDLLSVVHGFEGTIVKFVHNGCRFVQGRDIEAHMQEIALRIGFTGWICSRLKKFCVQKKAEKTSGLCSQRMCNVVEEELQAHRKLISLLDAKVHRDDSANICNGSNIHSGQLSLRKFEQAVFSLRTRLNSLLNILHGTSALKGGELLTALYKVSQDGDPDVQQLGSKLIAAAVEPFLIQLYQWVFAGYLNDPYHEFFVSVDSTVSSDTYWSDRYRTSESRRPYFLSADVARQLFSGGKSVAFIRNHCNIRCNIPGMEKYKSDWNPDSMELIWDYHENGIKPQHSAILCAASGTATKYVVDVLCNDHKLFIHLLALRKYFLMSRGDFVQTIMDNLWDRLDQPAMDVIYSTNLTATLYEAINMELEDPDVVKTLDTVMVPLGSDTELGWEAFSLEYRIKGPLVNVLNKNTITRYKRIFSHLWRIKRAEFMLSRIWRAEAELKAKFSGVEPLSHEIRLFVHRMLQFIRQLQYCFDMDVLQLGWNKQIITDGLMAAKSVDDMLGFHHTALNFIEDKCLLRESKNITSNCAVHLRVLLDQIISFERIYKDVNDSLARSNAEEELMEDTIFRKSQVVAQLHGKFTRDVAQFTAQLELYDADSSVRCQMDFNSHYQESDKKARNQEALNAAGFTNSSPVADCGSLGSEGSKSV